MSDLARSARVAVVMADYARIGQGKGDVLGAGWQVTSLGTEGLTNAFSIFVSIDIEPRFYGQEYAFELSLVDERTGEVVVPPAEGSTPLRIGQSVRADTPVFSGQYVPNGAVWARFQVVANFANGLPLAPGGTYTWQVRIDGELVPSASAGFHVAGPRPGPVLG
jgi:hypothetical protein